MLVRKNSGKLPFEMNARKNWLFCSKKEWKRKDIKTTKKSKSIARLHVRKKIIDTIKEKKQVCFVPKIYKLFRLNVKTK